MLKAIDWRAHSTTDGMEVITNVPPFRLRTWDLCMREYIRIKAKDPNHKLRSMMRNWMQIGQTLSPCAYLIQHSREWTTITEDLGETKHLPRHLTECWKYRES